MKAKYNTIEEFLSDVSDDLNEHFPDHVMTGVQIHSTDDDFLSNQGDEIEQYMEENGIYVYHEYNDDPTYH